MLSFFVSRRRSVRWDEEKLSEIESNKPIRQKITEPKTPYHHMPDNDGSLSPVSNPCLSEKDDDDTERSESIPSVFNDMISANCNNNSRASGWTTSDDEVDAMDEDNEGSEIGRSASFKDQRRAHYDEFHQVRELRRKASLHESSSDDNEEKLNGESDIPSSLAVGVEDIDITDVKDVREPQPQKSSSPA
ncbi:Protein phosphatase inhibitor 2 (IPP-2) [Artemisia annua]|uniref:Protein phosphatase inhibitor 2 (IPP-2) n=1 Tax=Artemisia annua TaxID=35608 RepID=A0A2U1Q7C5_ARTAN|nr:Protein phosphatase inhibitor 2 (IPP-2) [Artemisia annua]